MDRITRNKPKHLYPLESGLRSTGRIRNSIKKGWRLPSFLSFYM